MKIGERYKSLSYVKNILIAEIIDNGRAKIIYTEYPFDPWSQIDYEFRINISAWGYYPDKIRKINEV